MKYPLVKFSNPQKTVTWIVHLPAGKGRSYRQNDNKYEQMKEVLVFKTSINSRREVKVLKPDLNKLIAKRGYWNFDLEDCDNILRVETHLVPAISITKLLNEHGFLCEEL